MSYSKYPTLNRAMENKNITIKDIAKVIGTSEEEATKKLNSTRYEDDLTVNEAVAIRDKLFPYYALEFLYKLEKHEPEAKA